MEYQAFAYLYDLFYSNKDYEKEVNFLISFLKSKDNILDIGCGTGIHGSLLECKGYDVDGLDLSQEMLAIAKNRIHGNLYHQNMLNISIDKKYNVIISMFAVINHLQSIQELKQVLINLKGLLKPNGIIIIDLHNPQKSGTKIDEVNDMKRTMTWNYFKEDKKEYTNITYNVDGVDYHDHHEFTIFTISDMEKCAKEVGLKVINVFENYDISKKGNSLSKNLQFVISFDN